MPATRETRLRDRVAAVLSGDDRFVLAVSGGVDSMTMLDICASLVPRERLVVATFDHGTGAHARQGVRATIRAGKQLGLLVKRGVAQAPLSSEAEFRAARWHFLRSVADIERARILTAHTQDDQIETVLMRILRGAGARGIAGLFAESDVLRPLLGTTRAEVLEYARARKLEWIEDPTNQQPAYFRNRIRHDVLPQLRRVWPSVDQDLLMTARVAAVWRREVEVFVHERLEPRVVANGAGLDVPAEGLAGASEAEAAVVWPALAATVGLALDRRGTNRAAQFSARARVGSRIQLSGGWEITRSRDAFQLRTSRQERRRANVPLASTTQTTWGEWRFAPADQVRMGDPWHAELPAGRSLSIRAWRPGDTMQVRAGAQPKKVKRLLSEAGITGHDRTTWPVVLWRGQIVWVPGISRASVVPVRSGRPALAFSCDYDNR